MSPSLTPPWELAQLWASEADLALGGPPTEALASKTHAQKLYALRCASGELATALRGAHALPLAVGVEDATSAGLGAGSIEFGGPPREAVAALVRVVAGGAVGVDPVTVEVSWDFESYQDAQALPLDGTLELGGGVVLTFAGSLTAGGVVRYQAGVDHGLRRHVVAIAAWDLLYNRGVDPGSPQGKELRTRYEDANAWAEKIQGKTRNLDEGRDATPGLIERRPRYGRRKTSNGYLGPKPYGGS